MVPEDLPEGAASSAPEPTAERNPEAEAEVAESTEVAVVLDLVLGRIVLKVRPRRTLPSRFLEGEGPPSVSEFEEPPRFDALSLLDPIKTEEPEVSAEEIFEELAVSQKL